MRQRCTCLYECKFLQEHLQWHRTSIYSITNTDEQSWRNQTSGWREVAPEWRTRTWGTPQSRHRVSDVLLRHIHNKIPLRSPKKQKVNCSAPRLRVEGAVLHVLVWILDNIPSQSFLRSQELQRPPLDEILEMCCFGDVINFCFQKHNK